jgi:putative transcriptional regulator
MKITLDPAYPQTWPKGRVDTARLDATTESELGAQQAVDDANALQDAAKHAGVIRQSPGPTQAEK